MAHISVVYYDCEVDENQIIFIKDMNTETEAVEFGSKIIDSLKEAVELNNMKNIIDIIPFENQYNMPSFKGKFPLDTRTLFTGREGDLLAILNFKKVNGRYGSIRISIASEIGWWNNTLPSSFKQENVINEILNIFNKI